jgi:hypothetical protein
MPTDERISLGTGTREHCERLTPVSCSKHTVGASGPSLWRNEPEQAITRDPWAKRRGSNLAEIREMTGRAYPMLRAGYGVSKLF